MERRKFADGVKELESVISIFRLQRSGAFQGGMVIRMSGRSRGTWFPNSGKTSVDNTLDGLADIVEEL